MKDSYKVLENGKVDVIDYDRDGIKTSFQMEYQDNIEYILKQFNVREYLDLRKLILNSKISSNDRAIKNNKQVNIGFLLAWIIGTIIFGYMSTIIFSGISIATFLPFIIGSAIFGPLIAYSKKNIKKFKKNTSACISELEEIDKQLNETEKKIEELKKYNIRENEKTYKDLNKHIKIDSKEELEKIREYLHNFYVMGYYEEEFYKHFNNGTLENTLINEFDCKEEDVQFVMKHFEEKGPVLTKKYNKK